jgi:hypothetical protein
MDSLASQMHRLADNTNTSEDRTAMWAACHYDECVIAVTNAAQEGKFITDISSLGFLSSDIQGVGDAIRILFIADGFSSDWNEAGCLEVSW